MRHHRPRGRHPGRSVIALVSIGAVLAACGNDDDEGGTTPNTEREPTSVDLSPEVEALVEEAREEGGTLELTWGALNSQELLRDWEADFEATYGLPLSIEVAPNPSFSAAADIAIEEHGAGRTSSTDVLLGVVSGASQAAQAGIAAEVDWDDLGGNVAAALARSDEAVDAGGAAVGVYSIIFGVTYNLDSVSDEDVPDTLEGFADLDDDVALASEGINMWWLAHESKFGDELIPLFRDSFAPAVDGSMDCADMSRLTTGEFDVLALDCGKSFADVANAQGANLGWKVLEDAAMRGFVYVMPMAHAEHPATASLFVDYLVGESAQEILREHELVDLHYVEGSESARVIEQTEDAGVEFLVLTADLAAENPQILGEVLPEMFAILESGG